MMLLALLAAAETTATCGAKTTQTEMTMCEAQLAERADAEMNRVWKQVQATMQAADRDYDGPPQPGQPGYADALLASQRAWLRFRDAECLTESYEWRGGTMQPFTANQCMADVTAARTRQLRGLLAWNR